MQLLPLLTPDDTEAFRRAGLNNTAWLPNPLAFWPKDPVGRDPGGSSDAGLVTYLGRLSTEKGPGFLVDAWGRIADRYPGWSLRIVGSGPVEDAVRRQVSRLPAGADRVTFAPPVIDAQAELAGADILALPSLTEGLPLVLAEAMAMGLPCVATDCSSGIRLLTLDGAAARIVPRADPAALAAALAGLMADPAERAGLGIRAREAVRPYRADPVIDDWERMITAVLR